MNKTFAGIMAGVSIAMAGIFALLLLFGLLFGQFDVGGAWTLVRGVLLLALLVLNYRYFLARTR